MAITERDGLPIDPPHEAGFVGTPDVGRSRRLFTRPQRRALQARDGTCRFPGCGVPARRTHLHHLLAWELGGPTDLANAVCVCHAHHALLHAGHYRILGSPDSELRFETRDGRPIVPPPERIDPSQGGVTAHLRRLAQERGHQIGDGTPWALYGGQPPDYGLAIEMLIHNSNLGQAGAGPSPP